MTNEILINLLTSIIASCISEILTLPIYTVKTNYQNTDNISIIGIIKNLWNKHGILGFYNATGWIIFSQVLSTTLKYTIYQTLKQYSIYNIDKFIIGGISGICSSIITHPIDVIKIHYQMHTPIIPVIYKNGISVLYRAYSKSLIKTTVSSSLFFPLYDIFNTYINHNTTSALLSSIISTIVLQPIDYMKTRQAYGNNFIYSINTLTKGLFLNLSRTIPHFILTVNIIDYLKNNIFY